MSALVTNAESPKALVVTRSLGKKGIAVYSCSKERLAPTFFSKYCKKKFLYKDPEKNPRQFIDEMIKIVKKCQPKVLIPVNSVETLLIAKNVKKFPSFVKFPFVDYKAMSQMNDKLTLYQLVKSLDISTPETHEIKNKNELLSLTKKLEYPVVIKLRKKSGNKGLSYAYNRKELIGKFWQTVSLYQLSKNNYPIVQKYVSGKGYGVSVLFKKGKLRVLFVHKRLREFPITGGPSTCRISTKNLAMEKDAEKILSHLNWHGLAMVEFKYNLKTGKHYLIEINPRIWGSINQGICSGVDFPCLLYKLATEGDIPEIKTYKLGVKTRFFFNDIRSIFASIIKTKNIRLLSEIVKINKNLYYDSLSLEDPLPQLFFLCSGFRQILKELK